MKVQCDLCERVLTRKQFRTSHHTEEGTLVICWKCYAADAIEKESEKAFDLPVDRLRFKDGATFVIKFMEERLSL